MHRPSVPVESTAFPSTSSTPSLGNLDCDHDFVSSHKHKTSLDQGWLSRPFTSAHPSRRRLPRVLAGMWKRIYTYSGGYKTIKQNDITLNQCASACLADPNCQSFVWDTQGTGAKTPALCNRPVDTSPWQWGSTDPIEYDRSCILGLMCPQQPNDTVCVDRAGSNPSPSCGASFPGIPRNCASPMVTANLGLLCGPASAETSCMQHLLSLVLYGLRQRTLQSLRRHDQQCCHRARIRRAPSSKISHATPAAIGLFHPAISLCLMTLSSCPQNVPA